MFLSDLTATTPVPMLEKTLGFTEARNRVLVENIANITTPGYRAKQMDPGAFQNALKQAAEKQDEHGGPFELESGDQFRVNDEGFVEATPTLEPPENLLFHDGTNARIEREMSALAENTIMHQAAAELIKVYFNRIEGSIRGRVI